jgi:hypothetical protein
MPLPPWGEITNYMQFRAEHEGNVFPGDRYYRDRWKEGVRRFYGVSVAEDGTLISDYLRPGLIAEYRSMLQKRWEESRAYAQYERHLDDVAGEYGITSSTWSVWGDEDQQDFEAPHPFKGATTVVYESDPYWGEPSGKFSAPIKGERWVDLWVAADLILSKCGDKNHRFIESFDDCRNGNLLLGCGS